jgi:hypothetical protein
MQELTLEAVDRKPRVLSSWGGKITITLPVLAPKGRALLPKQLDWVLTNLTKDDLE